MVLSVLPDISAEHTFEMIPKSMILHNISKFSARSNEITLKYWVQLYAFVQSTFTFVKMYYFLLVKLKNN